MKLLQNKAVQTHSTKYISKNAFVLHPYALFRVLVFMDKLCEPQQAAWDRFGTVPTQKYGSIPNT